MSGPDRPPLSELQDRVRRDIDDRLASLRDRFGPVPVDRERVANDPDRFDSGVEMAAAGWRGDAGAWLTDPAGRALFIRQAGAPESWGIPGGGHEPGESHLETARREVREETGLEPSLTDVWRARRRTFFDASAPARDLEMLTVCFEGIASGCELDGSDREVLEAAWFETTTPAVAEEIQPRVERWARDC